MKHVDNITGSTEEIIKQCMKASELRHHFENLCPPGKIVLLSDLWPRNKIINALNKNTLEIFKNIKHDRLLDVVEYIPHSKSYNFPATRQKQSQFLGSKLHWLCNDIKINGLGYPTQGYMIPGGGYACHPGTYRYYATFVQQMDGPAFVWDTEDIYSKRPLQLDEWIKFCIEGDLREQVTIEIKNQDSLEENQHSHWKYLEIHFQRNHHVHCIFLYDKELARIYNSDLPTIYYSDDSVYEHAKETLDRPEFFKFKKIDHNFNKFMIPFNEQFKGVSMYLNKKYEQDFTFLFLYLDINDDVTYSEDKQTFIFNNSSFNCKKLIPGIINESTNDYLENFYWSNKNTCIAKNVENNL